MKTLLYKNVDLFRIPIKIGVTEYSFPTNVDWAGKKIQQLILCTSFGSFSSGGGVAYDPMDGVTPISGDLSNTQRDVFITMVNDKNTEFAHNLHLTALNWQLGYSAFEINEVLNLPLCRIKLTVEPEKDEMLLFYVVWDSEEIDNYDQPLSSLTVKFPMAAGEELTFRELINNYISAMPERVRGIIAWNSPNAPAYMTLRDKPQKRIFRNVHTQLMAPAQTNTVYGRLQPFLPEFYIEPMDIDFDYSRIRNAQNKACEQCLTFLY